MTDQERIAELERRVAELETQLSTDLKRVIQYVMRIDRKLPWEPDPAEPSLQ